MRVHGLDRTKTVLRQPMCAMCKKRPTWLGKGYIWCYNCVQIMRTGKEDKT